MFSYKIGVPVFFLYIFFPLVTQGQLDITPKNQKKYNYDTAYIGKFSKYISVEPIIAFPTFEFKITPSEDSLSSKGSSYQPYLRAALGVGLHYKALNFYISFRGPTSEAQEEKYGKTVYTIIKLRLCSRKVIYDVFYNYFKGFSDRNASNYDANSRIDGKYIKRQDITVQYGKLKATYVFSNKKFSYRASYNYSERQKKSMGTILLVAQTYRMGISGDSSFFNPGQRDFFKEYHAMQHLYVNSFGIGPGFAATFVEKNWFLSGGIYILGDLQYHFAREKNQRLISEGVRGALVGDAFLALGYNGDRFYSGLTVRGDRNGVSLPFIHARTTFYSWMLSVGFRFNTPGVVRKIYNWGPLRNMD